MEADPEHGHYIVNFFEVLKNTQDQSSGNYDIEKFAKHLLQFENPISLLEKMKECNVTCLNYYKANTEIVKKHKDLLAKINETQTQTKYDDFVAVVSKHSNNCATEFETELEIMKLNTYQIVLGYMNKNITDTHLTKLDAFLNKLNKKREEEEVKANTPVVVESAETADSDILSIKSTDTPEIKALKARTEKGIQLLGDKSRGELKYFDAFRHLKQTSRETGWSTSEGTSVTFDLNDGNGDSDFRYGFAARSWCYYDRKHIVIPSIMVMYGQDFLRTDRDQSILSFISKLSDTEKQIFWEYVKDCTYVALEENLHACQDTLNTNLSSKLRSINPDGTSLHEADVYTYMQERGLNPSKRFEENYHVRSIYKIREPLPMGNTDLVNGNTQVATPTPPIAPLTPPPAMTRLTNPEPVVPPIIVPNIITPPPIIETQARPQSQHISTPINMSAPEVMVRETTTTTNTAVVEKAPDPIEAMMQEIKEKVKPNELLTFGTESFENIYKEIGDADCDSTIDDSNYERNMKVFYIKIILGIKNLADKNIPIKKENVNPILKPISKQITDLYRIENIKTETRIKDLMAIISALK